MALPTIRYFEEASGSGVFTVEAWMTKLHTELTAAGWTIEYADSDAIGAGSSSNPAWDKTPATNTNAGIVVYRMPANGHPTQWYVRLRPGWPSNNTGSVHMRGITVGTNHDGSGGLTGGGTEASITGGNSASSGNWWRLAVSEDGFLVVNANRCVLVERARLPDGTVTDELLVATAQTVSAFRHVSASVGEVSTDAPVTLAGESLGASSVNAPDALSRDASGVVVIGPYWNRGYPLMGAPRLGVLASPASVTPSQDHDINVDGGPKTYRSAPAALTSGQSIWLVAME